MPRGKLNAPVLAGDGGRNQEKSWDSSWRMRPLTSIAIEEEFRKVRGGEWHREHWVVSKLRHIHRVGQKQLYSGSYGK